MSANHEFPGYISQCLFFILRVACLITGGHNIKKITCCRSLFKKSAVLKIMTLDQEYRFWGSINPTEIYTFLQIIQLLKQKTQKYWKTVIYFNKGLSIGLSFRK